MHQRLAEVEIVCELVIFTPGVMSYVEGKNRFGFNFDVFSRQTGETEYSFKVQGGHRAHPDINHRL